MPEFKSLAMAIMSFFGLSIRETANEIKTLSPEDRLYFEEEFKKVGITLTTSATKEDKN